VTVLVAQITDPHVRVPGRLAYRRVDTAAMLRDCVAAVGRLDPQPDLVVLTGDLVDFGQPEEYAHLRALLAPLRAPIVAVPGNHDEREAMRAAFADGGYLPAAGYLQFAIEGLPLRLVGLDTVVPGQGGGRLCEERLAWLDATLRARADAPTLVLMHHPPFVTGIGHMDQVGLEGREAFAAVLARHAQVQAVLCGHLHRPIFAAVGGRPALTGPSPAHQVALDVRDDAPSRFRMEPPAFMLHRWRDGALVSHVALVAEYEGPYPFFDADGRLID
jgi:3',5'-cyclic AMP phosphodiesterase CpdA